MPEQVTAFSVMISAPGEMKAAMDEIRDTLVSWTSTNLRRGASMVPLDWTRDAVPNLGASGQAIINEQLLGRADILYAVFGTRLGTPTEQYVSGTAEEIHEAHRQGKPVHVYFHTGDLPHNVNLDEVSAVREFKLQLEGLYLEFRDLHDLRQQVWRAIELDVTTLSRDKVQSQQARGSDLALQIDKLDDPRKPILVLRVRNVGDMMAEHIELEDDSNTLLSQESGKPLGPIVRTKWSPVSIPPGGTWPVGVVAPEGLTGFIAAKWHDQLRGTRTKLFWIKTSESDDDMEFDIFGHSIDDRHGTKERPYTS